MFWLFFRKNKYFQKKSQKCRNIFSKKVCENFLNSKKINFLSVKKIGIFVESQNTWKPRKSQFSAQSSHPPAECACKHFETPPSGTSLGIRIHIQKICCVYKRGDYFFLYEDGYFETRSCGYKTWFRNLKNIGIFPI